jgi:voltage-gated sodium channel
MLIIFNTAVLAIDDYPQSKEKGETLALINVCLCWIFFLEMALKLVGLGVSNYFKDSFNAFDSIVVFFSVVDFVITSVVAEEDLGSAIAVLQSIRALRMLRVVKLAR